MKTKKKVLQRGWQEWFGEKRITKGGIEMKLGLTWIREVKQKSTKVCSTVFHMWPNEKKWNEMKSLLKRQIKKNEKWNEMKWNEIPAEKADKEKWKMKNEMKWNEMKIKGRDKISKKESRHDRKVLTG